MSKNIIFFSQVIFFMFLLRDFDRSNCARLPCSPIALKLGGNALQTILRHWYASPLKRTPLRRVRAKTKFSVTLQYLQIKGHSGPANSTIRFRILSSIDLARWQILKPPESRDIGGGRRPSRPGIHAVPLSYLHILRHPRPEVSAIRFRIRSSIDLDRWQVLDASRIR